MFLTFQTIAKVTENLENTKKETVNLEKMGCTMMLALNILK